MPRLLPTIITLPPLLVITTLYLHYARLPTPTFTARTHLPATPLSASPSVRKHINPRDHPVLAETLTARFPRRKQPPLHSSADGSADAKPASPAATAAVLLPRLLHGFFSGWAFTPERLVLTALKRRKAGVAGSPAWHVPVAEEPVPEVGTVFFGIFEVLAADEGKEDGTAWVDLAFRGRANFAGVHRLEVGVSEDGEEVTASLSSMVCNPVEDRAPVRIWGLYAFHRLYEGFLFRDALAGVVGN